MRIIALVQARMGSRRLPGKSMMAVWRDTPLLELVLRRTSATPGLDGVVLATSRHPRDRQLIELAQRLGIPSSAGAEEDVLGRFAAAVGGREPEAVMRVCADNPLVDPAELGRLVEHFRTARTLHYSSNMGPESGLPIGLGAEVLSVEALIAAALEATAPDDREHVTTYVRARPERFRALSVPPPRPPWPRFRLDIDDEHDLRAVRAVIQALPAESAPLWTAGEIVAACERSAAAEQPASR